MGHAGGLPVRIEDSDVALKGPKFLVMVYCQRRVRTVGILLVVLLAGCAGRPLMPTPNLYTSATEQPFQQLAPALKTNQVDLLYVTDRVGEGNERGDLAYGHKRSPSVAFGSAMVQIGQDITWEQLKAESQKAKRQRRLRVRLETVEELGRFPATPFAFVRAQGQILDDPDMLRSFQETEQRFHGEVKRRLALTPRKDVYMYVHGYNTKFAGGAETLAELWHFMALVSVPLANGPDCVSLLMPWGLRKSLALSESSRPGFSQRRRIFPVPVGRLPLGRERCSMHAPCPLEASHVQCGFRSRVVSSTSLAMTPDFMPIEPGGVASGAPVAHRMSG